MPLYEYSCPKHGKFEKLRKMDKRHLPAVCPECNKSFSKIISTFNWSFGWRNTMNADYDKNSDPYEIERDI